MNHALIKKFFQSAVKKDKCLVHSLDGFGVLISEGHVLLVIPRQSPVFNDRELFPDLPEVGSCMMYQKLNGEIKVTGGPRLIDIWENAIKDSYLRIEQTCWLIDGHSYCRVLQDKHGRLTFLDEKFLNMLVCKGIELTKYEFKTKDRVSEGCNTYPVVVYKNDNPVGLILPVRANPVMLKVGDVTIKP